MLKREAALLIKGRVRHEENQRTKVVVSEARPLEAAVNGGKSRLRIRVNLAQAGESLAAELGDLMSAYPGDNSVVLELTRPGDFVATLRVSRPPAVKADEELMSRLRALCGESAIAIDKQE